MGPETDHDIRQVAYCPHCGNVAPQKLIHTQNYKELVFFPDQIGDLWDSSYYVASCETCGEILVYYDSGQSKGPDSFTQAQLVWPEKKRLNNAVPEQIRRLYQEATLIQRISPNAFAVQIRRGLEAICVDRGITERNLNAALKRLAENGEIPKTLAEATDILRLLGNVGAHWTGQQVDYAQTYALDDFFKAIVEYIYVAPSKLKEFRDQLASFNKAQDKDNNAK